MILFLVVLSSQKKSPAVMFGGARSVRWM